MKKNIISFCMTFAFIVPAIFLLSACGGTPTQKLERINTAEIVEIYQDCYGSVYADVTGFEHADYEFIGDSGRDAYSLEFSINNGDWFISNIIQDFYNEDGKGIYQIAYANVLNESNAITSYANAMTGQIIEPGEIAVSVRIPESNKYKESSASTPLTYSLKSNLSNNLTEKLDIFVAEGLGDNVALSSDENTKFVFYKDSSNPFLLHIGKYSSLHNGESGENSLYYLSILELTDEEQTEFNDLGLEFKVLSYDPKYVLEQTGEENGEQVNYQYIDSLSIESRENNAVYLTNGWSDNLNISAGKIWQYNYSPTESRKDIVFLVRQKVTSNSVQSPVVCINYTISYNNNAN